MKDRDHAFRQLIKRYEGDSALEQQQLIELLKETQGIYGFLTPEIQGEIAEALGLHPSVIAVLVKRIPSLKGKAYRHRITVCLGARCSSRNAHALLAAIEKGLGISPGQATRDGRFYLEICMCMRKCAVSPNLRVDEDIYSSARPEQIAGILENYK